MTAVSLEAGPVIRPHHRSPIRPRPATSSELELLLAGWATWMRGEGQRERTIVDCLGTLRRLAQTCRDPLAATPSDVNTFLARPVAPATRLNNYIQIKSFFRFLLMSGRRTDDPMSYLRAPKVPRTSPRPITTAQLETLLATRMHARTRTMILLAAFQGLRVHEIAKIKGADFDLERCQLWVAGKGGVTAVLPLHPNVADQLIYYPRDGYWFRTHVGNRQGESGPIMSKSVSTIIGNAMRRAGIPGNAHALRHWYATELVRSGADLRTAQTLLRHASLATTQRYVAIDTEQLTAAAIRLPHIDITAPVPATPAVEAARRREFHMRVGASPASVRSWARENGWEVARHGLLPWTILRAYDRAQSSH